MATEIEYEIVRRYVVVRHVRSVRGAVEQVSETERGSFTTPSAALRAVGDDMSLDEIAGHKPVFDRARLPW